MSQTTPRFPVDPARREALKTALLARHAQRYPAKSSRAHPWLPRLAMAGALGALLLVSFAAPAEHEVEVGRLLSLAVKGEAGPPDLKLLRPLLAQLVIEPEPHGQSARQRQLQVQLKRGPEGLVLQVELWGAQLVPDAAERLRAGIPALRDATITDEPLRGRARTRLGLLAFHWLLGLGDDPAQIAAATARLQAELAARGEDGKVEIKVERGEDGRKKVQVEVNATKTELREAPEAK
jgi:hypothetical protein